MTDIELTGESFGADPNRSLAAEVKGKLSLKESQSFNQRIMSWYGIIAFLILWQIAPYVGLVDGRFIPPVSEIVSDALKLVLNGQIFIHAAISAQRVLIGLIAAFIVAIPSAVVLAGWFPRLTRFMFPLLQLLGNINPFAIFPLFILFFGVGEIAKFAIIFWSSLFPILNTTINGVINIEPILLKAARSMGATKTTIFWKVVLPGALPSIITGFRMGATTAVLFLIAAEMLSASAGLGWLIHNSSVNYYIPRIYVGVVGIAVLGMLMNLLINKLETFFLDFKEEAKVD
ncbi:MAG: ABC transporter permease [Deltaproteobacteria bacterium]|jgi:NitT/TauT family transport system permease protein|nr:ABC transporter permease [Deltaproteobacteria bacterium]